MYLCAIYLCISVPSSCFLSVHPSIHSPLFLSTCSFCLFLRALTNTEGHCKVVSFLSSTVLINLFVFTYSYSWFTFRYSLMILTVILFPLEHCETQFLFSYMPVPGHFSQTSNSIKVEASFSYLVQGYCTLWWEMCQDILLSPLLVLLPTHHS